jgi:hypothetical protein
MVMTYVWELGVRTARYMTSGTIAYTREENGGGRKQLKAELLANHSNIYPGFIVRPSSSVQ